MSWILDSMLNNFINITQNNLKQQQTFLDIKGLFFKNELN